MNDFVEMKICDHNNLQALTIKVKADKQHCLIFLVYTFNKNIVYFKG